MPTHHRTCHLCEAMCGLEIEVDGDVITSIKGDDRDPLSRGHICPKAVALQDLHSDPDRLRHPVRRTATGWERLGWEEALDLVARRLRDVQAEHGREAVAVYQGNPSVHSLGAMLYGPPFVKALGTKSRFSATSVDQLPHHFAAWLMYGHQLLLPIPDIDRTDLFIVIGSNLLASNGSIMTVPDVRKRLRALQGRGGRLVVIDPRRTETAAIADQHVFVRPGTDALLLAAMVATLFAEGLVALDALASVVDGVDAVREAVAGFTPEATAPITGVPAGVVRGLARDLAGAKSAVCHARMGASTQEFGGLCQWLAQVLNVLTGNLDRPGGAMWTTPAVSILGRLSPGSAGRRRTRVRGLPSFGGELPVVALAEEIATPGEGRIRALVTAAGNPVLSTPGGSKLADALAGLDFMVSVDLYVNETTRHAHVILPPASPLERDHYDLVFNTLAVRNVARYSTPVFDKPADARHDWEIFAALESRLAKRGVRSRLARSVLHRLGPRGQVALGLRMGPYGSWNPLGGGLTLGQLLANPHGQDLGPLQPQLPGALRTPDKRIHLAPTELLADLPRLRERLDRGADEGLVLIGRRHLRSNNSWMHNSERLVRGKERCTLLVHPDDAARLGLRDGAAARVASRAGAVEAPVQVSDEVMPGVVSLPHGWGHGRQGVRLGVAAAHPGVSVNDVTDPERIDVLTGTAALNGVPVEVTAVP